MGQLRASAAEASLRPKVGGYMTGFAARVVPTTGIHDANMARAVLLDDGDTLFAIVSCDCIGFSSEQVADMRGRIAAKSRIPADNVFICCTHTHSGPTTMRMRGVLGYIDEQWVSECLTTIVDLVSALPDRLQPARLAWSSATVTGVGFNRQDGTRPIDEELVSISIESSSGDTIATLLSYATHAVVLGPSNLLYSGDFPAAAARQVAAARGGVGLYLQGSCGDVNPIVRRDAVGEIGTFDDCEAIGAKLAAAAVESLASAPRTSEVSIRTLRKTLDVPVDPPPALEEVDAMIARFEFDRQAALAEQPVNRVAELIAVAYGDWARELKERIVAGTMPTSVPAEVYAAAINDLRIIGTPFEAYSDVGLGIKRGLEPLKGVFVGYANGLWGYCPTGWAKDQGGYGPGDSFRWFGGLLTSIGYGADELLIREASALGRSV